MKKKIKLKKPEMFPVIFNKKSCKLPYGYNENSAKKFKAFLKFMYLIQRYQQISYFKFQS